MRNERDHSEAVPPTRQGRCKRDLVWRLVAFYLKYIQIEEAEDGTNETLLTNQGGSEIRFLLTSRLLWTVWLLQLHAATDHFSKSTLSFCSIYAPVSMKQWCGLHMHVCAGTFVPIKSCIYVYVVLQRKCLMYMLCLLPSLSPYLSPFLYGLYDIIRIKDYIVTADVPCLQLYNAELIKEKW